MTHPTSYPGGQPPQLTVAVTGSSGLIGSAVIRVFEQRGHAIRRLVRHAPRGAGEIAWNPANGTIDAAALEGTDVVINLAGERVDQRWSESVKRRIRDSRVKGTDLIARTISALSNKPRVLLNASGTTIYGAHRADTVDEQSSFGDDFLASVAKEWEAATRPASDAGIRVVNMRAGVVISRDGGMVKKLLLPFTLGVGAKLGSGEQWLSWIALADYIEALAFLIDAPSIAGPVNLVSPNPVTNAEFTRLFGRVLRRPAVFVLPRFALSLAFGQMADETALADQRVRPRRLLEAGFQFTLPTLEAALRAELTRSPAESATRSTH